MHPPVASHDVGNLDDLVSGRVFVFSIAGVGVHGQYVHPSTVTSGRKVNICYFGGGLREGYDGRGRHAPDRRSRAYIAGFVPVYEPESGAYREYGFTRDEKWERPASGWVQDTRPRVLADACPDLPLPRELQINEAQTARSLGALRKQDPDAPIRNFEGDARVYRVPVREFLDRLPQHDGELFVSRRANGLSYGVVFARHSVVWRRPGQGRAPYRTSLAELDAEAEIYRERWRQDFGDVKSGVAEWGLDDWIGFEPQMS